MKTALLTLLLIPSIIYAQEATIDQSTGKYVIDRVIEANGSKEVLYDNALTYLANNLGSSNDAIQVRDKEGGRIVTKMSVKSDVKQGTVSASVTILFKDGRYKYTATNFRYDGYYFSSSLNWKPWNFEDNVNFIMNDVTKKEQETIRLNAFEKFSGILSNMKSQLTTKKEEW